MSHPDPLLVGLQSLPPLEREVITLVYFQRKTQEQIATTLAVPRDAVANAVATALSRLALFLQQTPEDDAAPM